MSHPHHLTVLVKVWAQGLKPGELSRFAAMTPRADFNRWYQRHDPLKTRDVVSLDVEFEGLVADAGVDEHVRIARARPEHTSFF